MDWSDHKPSAGRHRIDETWGPVPGRCDSHRLTASVEKLFRLSFRAWMPESSCHRRQPPTVAYIPVTWIPAFHAGMTMILAKSLWRFRPQSQLLRHLLSPPEDVAKLFCSSFRAWVPESSCHGRQPPTVAYIPVTWIPAFHAGMTMALSNSLRRFRPQSQLLRHLLSPPEGVAKLFCSSFRAGMPESSCHGRQPPTVAYIPVTWIPAFHAGMTMILAKSLRRFRPQSQLLRHLLSPPEGVAKLFCSSFRAWMPESSCHGRQPPTVAYIPVT